MRSLPCALLAMLVASSSLAAEDPPVAALRLPRGRMMWGLGGNVGFPTGDHASSFGAVILQFDRVVSEPGGPGWLRGQLGYGIELLPVFLLSEGQTTYGAGFNLLGRHYLRPDSAVRPFISLGAGLIVSKEKIPTGVANLNFTPQLGFGLLFSDRRGDAYSLEVRFHHLSNGGLESPNPGINSILVQFGLRFHAVVAASEAGARPDGSRTIH